MTHLLSHIAEIHENLSRVELIEHALKRGEAKLGSDGQLCVLTGEHTGRAASDKYIVSNAENASQIAWGAAGSPIAFEDFERLKDLVRTHLDGKVVYVVNFVAGRRRCRLVTELAWQALFVSNLFTQTFDRSDRPDLTIIAVPYCEAVPSIHKTRSATFIASDFNAGLTLIGGTAYAGEIKKSVFTYLSWFLPLEGVMPMHSSVTSDEKGRNVAVFFGLSGTGKTTLSADPERRLLGDDEHGWYDNGVFNFEGGCYAKAIKLSPEGEPSIWSACHRLGTVLENVVVCARSRTVDFDSAKHAENTRAAYSLDAIEGSWFSGTILDHPKTIIMLTCDAYGVLPSVSKLTPEAAIYHFLSGYTAKVAGTEKGVVEPTATFSTCFGAPFMPHHASVYAELFQRFLTEHSPRIFLVNTGWAKGPAGVGMRMRLDYTRNVITSILCGDFDETPTKKLMPFNLDVPEGIPDEDPGRLWQNREAYDAQAKMLAQKFVDNFAKFKNVSKAVIDAGPKL